MPQVLTGLDVLVEEKFNRLQGKKVGILAHPASIDRHVIHILDRALEFGVQVKQLFGAEHGFWGNAQYMEGVDDTVDERTSIPVTSLYGHTRESLLLNPDLLTGLDVLICDLQDIGTRYYTFAYTIAFAIKACAKASIKCMVLDRPNPLGGLQKEGNLVEPGFESFVGEYPLQNRHGMTLGELARFFMNHDKINCDLEVVEMRGWSKEFYFEQTGLPWVLPSPNMPTPDTAVVYPGACLFEGTNVSEGRGTTRPFEIIGASYIADPWKFVELANAYGVPGAVLRPCWFTPTFDKHAGKLCGGLQIHVTDRALFNSMRTGVAVLWASMQFEGFDWRREPYEFVSDRLAIDLLFGTDRARLALEAGQGFEELCRLLNL